MGFGISTLYTAFKLLSKMPLKVSHFEVSTEVIKHLCHLTQVYQAVYSPKSSRDHTISSIQTHLNFDHGFIKRVQWYYKMFSTRYTAV